jgi:glycosyltransferase involved in cell wall biosynthesis
MNVAFLQATLPLGGAERLAQSLLLGLDRARFRAIAVNLYGPGPIGAQLAAAGVPVVSGLARGPWDPGTGARLARVWAEHATDVVVVADSALPLWWAGWRRRRAPRPRLVLTFHSTGKRGDRLQHALANACAFPVTDRFVALAPSHRDFLTKAFGLSPGRFAVIPNGVDTARFSPSADRAAARREAGLDPARLHVGIVAALRPEKHHGLFLAMAALLVPRHPEARFVIVGDGPERARLEAETRARGLGGAVAFLGARDDIPALARALDVAVLCSRPVVETLPVTLLEAHASGVPAVSTDVGSIRDVVAEGETGFLVPPGDAGGLAAAVGTLLADAPMRERFGRAARARVMRDFTLEAMMAGYDRLLAGVGGT